MKIFTSSLEGGGGQEGNNEVGITTSTVCPTRWESLLKINAQHIILFYSFFLVEMHTETRIAVFPVLITAEALYHILHSKCKSLPFGTVMRSTYHLHLFPGYGKIFCNVYVAAQSSIK